MTLLVTFGLIAGSAVLFASTSTVLVAVVAYLAISALRPVYGPLLTLGIVERIEPGYRATALSTRGLFDSGGQILGGPLIGLVGTLATLRTALQARAAAFLPALVLLGLASQRVTCVPPTGITAEPVATPHEKDVPGQATSGLPRAGSREQPGLDALRERDRARRPRSSPTRRLPGSSAETGSPCRGPGSRSPCSSRSPVFEQVRPERAGQWLAARSLIV